MQRTMKLVAVGAIMLAPALALSTPASGQPPAPGSISPNHDTGQQVPPLECEDGVAPGNSGREPGPGSPFQEDSISGSHYAGEQPGINDKNTAAVSQYDVACFGGPPA
jgi:hypothetical protein